MRPAMTRFSLRSNRSSARSKASAALPRQRQDFAKICVGVGLSVEHLRLGGDRDSLSCQPFRLCVLAAVCQHLRADLPPEDLRSCVVRCPELLRTRGPPLGLLELPERVVRLCRAAGGCGEMGPVAELLVQPAALLAQGDR